MQHLLHGFRRYAVGDLRVELVGEELVQRNPAAFEIDALGPGTDDLQLALQPARLFRRAPDLIERLLQFLPHLQLLVQALPQVLHEQTDARKGQEADQAVGITKDLYRILMVGKDIHDAPGHPGQNRHADHRYPPQIPAAQRDRDEEEDEEEEVISREVHAVAQDEQVGQARQNNLQLKALVHVIRRHLMPSDPNKSTV